MKKRTCTILAAIGLTLGLTVPIGAYEATTTRLDFWDNNYEYFYIDFNQDGQMELVIIGGGQGQYEYTIYAYADHAVHAFQPAINSKEVRFPSGYRNKDTGELKWFILEWSYWGPINVYEILFDFQAFQYHTIERIKPDLAVLSQDFADKYEQRSAFAPNIEEYTSWAETWEYESPGEAHHKKGTVDEQLLEQLLLQDPTSLSPPTNPRRSFWLVIPVGVALVATIIGITLYFRKRRP